jgi:hypothetical protein
MRVYCARMVFDLIVACVVAVAQFTMGYLAWHVTMYPPHSKKLKRRYEFLFVVCGFVTIGLVTDASGSGRACPLEPERHIIFDLRW